MEAPDHFGGRVYRAERRSHGRLAFGALRPFARHRSSAFGAPSGVPRCFVAERLHFGIEVLLDAFRARRNDAEHGQQAIGFIDRGGIMRRNLVTVASRIAWEYLESILGERMLPEYSLWRTSPCDNRSHTAGNVPLRSSTAGAQRRPAMHDSAFPLDAEEQFLRIEDDILGLHGAVRSAEASLRTIYPQAPLVIEPPRPRASVEVLHPMRIAHEVQHPMPSALGFPTADDSVFLFETHRSHGASTSARLPSLLAQRHAHPLARITCLAHAGVVWR